ncbi:MAG: hypothetical protein A4E23_00142 [Methanomethylovorans sp. PtaU1.Bin073]|nr:MAG: hypothetical protein A4E23_00142 [Methanomethylovorans sp. PtaU1.Bin073]
MAISRQAGEGYSDRADAGGSVVAGMGGGGWKESYAAQ